MATVRSKTPSETAHGVTSVLVLMARHRSGLPFHEVLEPSFVEQATELCRRLGGEPLDLGRPDRWLGMFATPSLAITAAHELLVQFALSGLASGLIGVAAGIATDECSKGPCIRDFRGLQVAQQYATTAEAEQILVDGATKELARLHLNAGYSFQDLGRATDGPPEEHGNLFQILHPQLRQAFRARRTVDRRKNSLPGRTTSFVGRELEIQSLNERLDSGGFVTVTGSAGIGKSALAIRVAGERLEEYADGIEYVDLRNSRPSEDLFEIIVRRLRASISPGWTSDESLRFNLGSTETLIVLDNADEYIGQMRSRFETILQHCSGVQILATSRMPLRSRFETRFALGPFAIPETVAEAEALNLDAVRLYDDRGGQTSTTFSVNSSNVFDVLTVCRRLEGNPLAIELAASQSSVWSPTDLLSAWEELGLSESLESTLAWTVEQLDADHQRVFRWLALIQGEVTPPSVVAYLGNQGLSAPRIHSLLGSLTDLQLLRSRAMGSAGELALQLPNHARSLATKKLREVGEFEEAQLAHSAWLVSAVCEAESAIVGPDQDIWTTRLQRLMPDAIAVVCRAIERNDAAESARVLAVCGTLWARLPQLADINLLERFLKSFSEPTSDALRIRLILGIIYSSLGSYDLARASLLTTYALAKHRGDPLNAGKALSNLGRIEWNHGHRRRGTRYVTRAASIFEHAGEGGTYVATLLGLATTLLDDGKIRDAKLVYGRVQQHLRRHKDRYLSIYLNCGLARVALADTDYPSAQALWIEAASIALKHGYSSELGSIMICLGDVEAHEQRDERALKLLATVRGACARREIKLEAQDLLLMERLFADTAARGDQSMHRFLSDWEQIPISCMFSTMFR